MAAAPSRSLLHDPHHAVQPHRRPPAARNNERGVSSATAAPPLCSGASMLRDPPRPRQAPAVGSMQLLWGPRRRQPGAATEPAAAETPAPAADAAVTSKSPCFGGSGASASLRYRVLAFALLGLAMNVHGASRGRRDWVLRYDGTFTRPPPTHRIPRSGLSVTLGLGTVHAYVSAASCLLLLTAAFTTRRWLCLPALLLTASDLLGDVSDAVVASAMLTLYSGLLPALLYAAFAALVIALEYYLWSGALRWYEQGIAVHVRRLDQRIRGRIATAADSSASSVMDCNGAF